MSQETFYFPHDYDPFQDMKMEPFVAKHGAAGYGVFWRLVEMLHSDTDHLLPLKPYVYESVANKLKLTPTLVEQIIEDCICKYCLFDGNGEFFWSNRVFKNVEKRKAISEQRSAAGKASADQRKKNKEIADGLIEQISTTVNEPLTTVNKERKKESFSILR